ncbi:putative sesquiterpene cyclase protein [Botrytis fragariae]|uniref:Putative sesquiterpene cyclase protein n=1 Tax=Botrytis fragariae TaxID=1964551 RepID=A0A8H6ALD7_9HELO|nr:putative sesquiterpene cyclase protein [Botrytis fragariae]KAF5869607.1 putative sesquiterpene cyclase protein [Botrytis fragariae]
MLELIAVDSPSTSMEMRNGFTLAGLAKKELRPGLAHRVVLATSYMYPNAGKRRARIIALRPKFLEKDKMEETPEGTPLMNSREQFLGHFRSPNDILPSDSVISDFHRHLEFTVRAVADEDEISGNGGKDTIAALLGTFPCVHPKGGFHSLEEYLSFRRLNVGVQFVIAAAKFTIKSSVDVQDPRFARYLRLISDHLGIFNDMASYEKESRALKEGEIQDMINIVAVFQHLKSLPTSAEAKVAAYTYQLQVESWITEEVEILAARGDLTDEEWWFLEAIFMTATGNVFFCMTSSRYGGDVAKLT